MADTLPRAYYTEPQEINYLNRILSYDILSNPPLNHQPSNWWYSFISNINRRKTNEH